MKAKYGPAQKKRGLAAANRLPPSAFEKLFRDQGAYLWCSKQKAGAKPITAFDTHGAPFFCGTSTLRSISNNFSEALIFGYFASRQSNVKKA